MSGYADDPTVAPDDSLWRRIPPWHLVRDGAGGRRISSAAFDNDPDGHPMSVTLGTEALAAGREPRSYLDGLPGFSMAAITARLARSLD